MKRFTKALKTLLMFSFASVVAATTAVAQLNINVRLDENGHGVITGAGPAGLPDPYLLPFSTTIADPVSGLFTLSYALPTTVTPGDVLLMEPGTGSAVAVVSDLIRFSTDRIFFFSDSEPTDLPPFDLADVLVLPPPNTRGPVVLVDEVGPEGNNGAFWKPLTANDPGFVTGAPVGPSVTYQFISDVPEPSTLALLGLAGGLATLRFRRRS